MKEIRNIKVEDLRACWDEYVSPTPLATVTSSFRVEDGALNWGVLEKLVALLDTKEIDVNSYSERGSCDTCHYGEEEGLEFSLPFQIRIID